ncbi:LysM peptidoglycan-binding domain-containing protein [Tenacibaculum sp. S7007]|uniref:LysM peptidoglycan-binding domain-containing protein n=1 Tax=Tenacibaculum pelagium TaxID=2759527 RepID=A0A839AIZ8_9FLAO|nr:LysM peptidoglycan-binding domain-containing protein [Tenacibaculum pelagium]MBA6155045.1 LysM peptidoglycan-binding domain-containing protein [Tenacibaculum pelagium]
MKVKLALIITLFFGINIFSQSNKLPEGWDQILLEGKPAYMNLITGDVSKKRPTKPATKPIKKKEFDPTITHIVKKGETLSSIARKYGFNLAKLYQLNNMTNFDNVEIGDEIVIGYVKNEKEKEAFFKGNINSSDNVPESIDEVKNNNHHVVASGETLYRIATNNKISVNKLKALNNLKNNAIFVGQKLRIK